MPAGSIYSGSPLRDPRTCRGPSIAYGRAGGTAARIDTAIAEILRDGSYRQLIARFFPFDIL